jgi:hypothetical protein
VATRQAPGRLGKPGLVGQAGEQPVYLLLAFNWFWATNHNRKWYPKLASWYAAARQALGNDVPGNPRRRSMGVVSRR